MVLSISYFHFIWLKMFIVYGYSLYFGYLTTIYFIISFFLLLDFMTATRHFNAYFNIFNLSGHAVLLLTFFF